ncbi:MAG: tetratricopeptide repeat protein [Cyclobacteriaceae bacterium]|nr:tetratricopeptide repeat protein [Cyclobacteriaceae bacterium]
MKWLLVLFWVMSPVVMHSQSKEDSLLRILPGMKEDSLKVQIYIELQGEVYRTDLNRALKYANQAVDLAGKLGMSRKQAEARWHKSYALTDLKRFDEAQKESEAALLYFKEQGDLNWIADVKMQLAHIARSQAKYEQAIAKYLEVLTVSKEIGDKNREALVHNSLGQIYKSQKQYEKALENYQRALVLVKEINLIRGISACLTNLADTYNLMEEYDKAILYHNESLNIKMETGDKLGEARVRNSLGIVYNNLEQYKEAEDHFSKAHQLAGEVGDQWLVAAIEYGMSRSAFGNGNYHESIEMALKVLKNVEVFDDPNFEVKAYNGLATAYSKIGDYQNAYTYSVKVQELSDSLYNEKVVRVTNDLEAKYQNEQKAKEIALLESEKELGELQLSKRVNERNMIIAFALIMLILTALLYNQYRIKQNANKKLQELDRLKSNFFANISHEFRTPLTLIKGPIEQLEQNPDEKLSRENIRMIRRNATRVLKLVNQLLDLSEINDGKLRLEPTEGDVFKCLRAAASSFNSHAAQRQIDYRVQIPLRPLWASFDRDKLEKISYNLLSNAFKFSKDGMVISIEVTHVDHHLQIQVVDSGKGIPREKLPFIFDRFYQVDSSSSREQEGSGIGLSLSKDLIELMDGTITVSSEVGKGSSFRVHLPMQEIQMGKEKALQKAADVQEVMPVTTSFELTRKDSRPLPTILLVEDNRDMRHFIREQLIEEYIVQEAEDGKIGLQMANTEIPDLIITDLMMPKMDGMEFCKQIKAHVNTSHIPVIMLTAKAGTDNKIHGLETGADEYLTKPFDAHELLIRTKNLIEQRKKLRELFSLKDLQIDPKKVKVTTVDQKFLEELLELLEQHYSDFHFGVPQMQEALALSKSQLHRKLKALTNEAPGELLRNFRLKRAAQLLAQKSDTVTQIAYQVGFNDLSYFTKCFKELHGVVPSSY